MKIGTNRVETSTASAVLEAHAALMRAGSADRDGARETRDHRFEQMIAQREQVVALNREKADHAFSAALVESITEVAALGVGVALGMVSGGLASAAAAAAAEGAAASAAAAVSGVSAAAEAAAAAAAQTAASAAMAAGLAAGAPLGASGLGHLASNLLFKGRMGELERCAGLAELGASRLQKQVDERSAEAQDAREQFKQAFEQMQATLQSDARAFEKLCG